MPANIWTGENGLESAESWMGKLVKAFPNLGESRNDAKPLPLSHESTRHVQCIVWDDFSRNISGQKIFLILRRLKM